MGHDYTPDQLEFIKTEWNDGYSASDIASRFNRRFGTRLSRNAICGKAHRMHLPEKHTGAIWQTAGTAKRLATMRAKGVTTAPKPKKPVLAVPEAPSEEPKPLGAPGIHLFRGCRWITGDDPKTWRFCGHPQKAGTAYCSHHADRCLPPKHPVQGPKRHIVMNQDRQFR